MIKEPCPIWLKLGRKSIVIGIKIISCPLNVHKKWNEMMAIWYSTRLYCMQPQRCFTFHSSAGLFSLEPSQLPGEYSASRHRITCRGLEFYSCHHCLLLSIHSHLGKVGVFRSVNEGPLHSLTLPQCEKSRFRNLHIIGAVQHWMPNSVSTDATYPSTNQTHRGSTLSMLQNWYLRT